jgi:hypothetical protein
VVKSLESWTIDWNVGSWKGWKRWDNGWMKLAKSKLEVTRQLGVSFIIPLLHKNLNTFSLDSFQLKMGQNSSYVTHTLASSLKRWEQAPRNKVSSKCFLQGNRRTHVLKIFIHCAILSNAILEWRSMTKFCRLFIMGNQPSKKERYNPNCILITITFF